LKFTNKIPENILRGVIIFITLYCLTIIGIIFVKATFTERLRVDDLKKKILLDSNNSVAALVYDITLNGVSYQAGIREGDTILFLNGLEFKNDADYQRILNQTRQNDFVNYTVKRGNEILNFKVKPYKYFHLVYYIFFALSFGFLVIGFLVGYSKPREYISQVFFLLGCASSFGFNTFGGVWNYIGMDSFIWYNLTYGAIFMFPLFFHFFLIYPVNYEFKFRRVLIPLIYIYIISLIIYSHFFIFIKNYIPVIIMPVIQISPLIFLFGGFILFIRSFTKVKDQFLKKSLRIIGFGFLIGGIGFVYYILVFNIFYKEFSLNPLFRLPTILLLAIPISFGYSIFKYRILDTEFIVKKGIVFGFVTAILICFYLLFLFTIDLLLSQFIDENRQLFTIGLIIVITFTFDFVNKKVKEFVDKQFYRERYNYRQALLKFAEELPYIKDKNEILTKIGKSVNETMGIEKINIWLNEERFPIKHENPDNDKFYHNLGKGFKKIFKENTEPVNFLAPDYSVQNLINSEIHKFSKNEKLILSVPIFLKDNLIGTINFGEKKSGKAYSDEDIDLLKTLASQSAVAFENARLQSEEINKRKIESELKIARQIQFGLLPKRENIIRGIEVSTYYQPAKDVGGDFYDIIKISEDEFIITVADVSGKGIPAALYMSKIQAMIQIASKIYKNPKEILIEVNKRVKDFIDNKSFVTVILALINLKSKIISICRAGHPPAIVFGENGVRLINESGIGVGISKDSIFDDNLTVSEIKLTNNEFFIFYSDGLIETMDKNNELFGIDRLIKNLKTHKFNSAVQYKDMINEKISEFKGEKIQQDDITFVILKVDNL